MVLVCSFWEAEAECGAEECKKQTLDAGDLQECPVLGDPGLVCQTHMQFVLLCSGQTPYHFLAFKIHVSESSDSVIIHDGPTSKKAEAVHTWGKWRDSFTWYFFHREEICPKKKEKIVSWTYFTDRNIIGEGYLNIFQEITLSY